MTEKMYLVGIRWVGSPMRPERVDNALSTFGDWFRYSGTTWFVWSDARANTISDALRARLESSDSLVVVRVDPTEAAGWAPSQVWEWLKSKAPASYAGAFAEGDAVPPFRAE